MSVVKPSAAPHLSGLFLSKPLRIPNPNPLRLATRRLPLKASIPATTASTAASSAGKNRVEILSESLPFIQRFHGKTIVVKYGGAAMKSPDLQSSVINDLVLLSCVGLRPVLVHGGGPEINAWLLRLGVEPRFHNGLRVTDALTMEVVEMVLAGKVNKSLVSLINVAGATAVGLCGKDAHLITARPSPDSAALGFVGEIAKVDPTVLLPIIADGHIPVIASVAADKHGQAYNVNADTVAGEIAAAVGAEKLILLTDVAGILRDRNDPGSLVREIDVGGVRKMMEEGRIAGGMIPKVDCCARSLAQGVNTASIIDGRVPHSLLLEILTDEGVGTMITGSDCPWTDLLRADFIIQTSSGRTSSGRTLILADLDVADWILTDFVMTDLILADFILADLTLADFDPGGLGCGRLDLGGLDPDRLCHGGL